MPNAPAVAARRGAAGALRAFVAKEVRHVARDRQTLAILLLMPLVQVLLFGFAIRTDVREVRLAVVDPAPDAESLRLRARLAGSGRFRVVAVAARADAVAPLFRRGEADAAVLVAPNLADRLARGRAGADVLVVTDASDPNGGSTVQAYLLTALADFEPGGRAPRIALAARFRFNPTLASANLFVPGLVALVLTIVSALMTAVSLSREKERGTLEVLLVSPLRPWQIVVGKVLPYLALGVLITGTVLLAARLVFDVPLRGSVALLLAESVLFTLVSLALGVVIAARTPSQRAAMLAALVGTMLPTALLSGMIFPTASMPEPLRSLTYLVPARWFLVIARGIMLKGVGLAHLWRETLVLLLMTAALLAAAVRGFRARLA